MSAPKPDPVNGSAAESSATLRRSGARAQSVQKWGALGRWRERVLGLTRLTAYVFCAALLCAAVGSRVVYADLREGTLQAGRELASVGDVLGTTKTIFLNGAAMNVSNALTDQTPTQVLDRFEDLCRSHPQGLARALADVPAALQGEVAKRLPDDTARAGVLRAEANGDGALTCFMDDRPFSIKDIPDRIKAFLESFDLSEFGRYRYVYATRVKEGQTRVLTVWTDGRMPLQQMFPAQGDAAGEDTTVVPRPPSSRRILSAAAAQVPFGVYVYDSQLNKEELRGYYDHKMSSLGWTAANGGVETKNTVVYVADAGNMLYVTLAAKDRHTLVTAIQTTRTGSPGEVMVRAAN